MEPGGGGDLLPLHIKTPKTKTQKVSPSYLKLAMEFKIKERKTKNPIQ